MKYESNLPDDRVPEDIQQFASAVLDSFESTESPEIILHVYQAIDRNPTFESQYEVLEESYGQAVLNDGIDRAVRQILNREIDKPGVMVFTTDRARSYSRLKRAIVVEDVDADANTDEE